jgi:hypothetical protein
MHAVPHPLALPLPHCLTASLPHSLSRSLARACRYQHKDQQEHKIFEEKMAQYDRRLMRRPEETPADATTRRGKLTVEEENDLRQDVSKAAWVLMKDKANIQASKEKVQTCVVVLDLLLSLLLLLSLFLLLLLCCCLFAHCLLQN